MHLNSQNSRVKIEKSRFSALDIFYYNVQAMINIDGAIGGGSVVRIAIGLACALEIPVCVFNIREGRSKPGLQAQHLAGVRACTKLTNAEVKGVKLGAQEIEFYPGKGCKNQIKVTIPTAGSVGLALQPIQLACIKSPHKVEVKVNGGATFGKWAPPIFYLDKVNFALLERFGYPSEIKIQKHGFFPKGGATIKATFHPSSVGKKIEIIKRGPIKRIGGYSIASYHLEKPEVAKRQAEAAREVLTKKLAISDSVVQIDYDYVQAQCPGSGIVLWALCENTIIGADSLGERGKPSEQVGAEAARDLIETIQTGASFDKYMSDQIMPFMGLYGGVFRYAELTDHMKTNIKIVEKITEKKFTTEADFIEAV